MDVNQARTVSTQKGMKAKMDIHKEKMETTIHSIQFYLETIKQVEDALSCVDQKTQGLCKGLTEKTTEPQVDLQAVKTSINTWTGSLEGNITVVKKDFHKAIENTRDSLHEELLSHVSG
jgi:hypothetical protein